MPGGPVFVELQAGPRAHPVHLINDNYRFSAGIPSGW